MLGVLLVVMGELIEKHPESETAPPEVASQLRFASPPYFTRVFTRRFGVSPTEFRRQAARNG